MDDVVSQINLLVTSYGLRVVGAIVILVVGFAGARMGRRATVNVLQRANVDPSLVGFTGSLIYFFILTIAVVATLSKFGIETTSFVAVLGAVGFAVGFALQGSLSNLAAGILLLLFRPFRIGDFIEAAGIMGTVKEIHLFNTILATPDNVKIVVPNGKVYGDTIKNYSANDTRRLDLVVGISYESSIPLAMETARGIADGDERVLADPEPMVVVTELADSSVNVLLRVWIRKEDYWAVKFDLTRLLKTTFDEKGIEIPFPQRVVHMVGGAAT
jgi:small conductance mechanosensitive channel